MAETELTLHDKLLAERDYYLRKTDVDPVTGKTVAELRADHKRAVAEAQAKLDERQAKALAAPKAEPKPYDWRKDQLPSSPANRTEVTDVAEPDGDPDTDI